MRFIATEMFTDTKGISPVIVNELFDRNERNNYSLRYSSDFSLVIVKTLFSGLETVSCLDPKLWEIVST